MTQNSVTVPENNLRHPLPIAPVIKIEHLVKRYKKAEKNAVDDISFTVAPGTLFTLLGPNGSGKTTTISIITTTLAPTSGSVQIAGYDLASQALQVRRQIGVVFQKPSLDLNLTAEENVRLHATLYGIYPYRLAYRLMPVAYRNQIASLAAILGIEKELFKPVNTFSGGMKRKLEILRSLLHQPTVLFLDEPTTGLDAESRRGLWDHLHQIRATGNTTIFLTTHYLEEAERADQVLIINHGRIIGTGTPQQIKDDLTRPMLFIDADDRARLRTELTQANLTFTEEQFFSLPIESRNVHQFLQQIATPLNMVRTYSPSLEDAYLHLIKQKQTESEGENNDE
jgi:ABC-2 type transport system ATP-binding protein